LIVIERKQ
jgi:hypothetical protein